MFRHRIRDLMIVNAVLAIVLAAAIALKSFAPMIAGVVVVVVLPLALVESYLYRKKKGTWHRWRHPVKPRPHYAATISPPPYPRIEPFPWAGGSLPGDPPSPARSRTRLFESGDASDPVSRASILLKVANRLETSGSVGAAVKIYQQVIDEFADAPEALNAAQRLQSIAERYERVGSPEAG